MSGARRCLNNHGEARGLAPPLVALAAGSGDIPAEIHLRREIEAAIDGLKTIG